MSRARGIERREVEAVAANGLKGLRARDGVRNQRLDDVPRDAAVAARKRLPAGFGAVVERVQSVEGVSAIAGKHVRPRAEPASRVHHQGPNRLAAEAISFHQVLLERDAVEIPSLFVARVIERYAGF